METILRGSTKQVRIRVGGPVIIIGEKINPSGRKKLAAALEKHDFATIEELAVSQVAAGADLLDVNVGAPGIDDVALLPEVVKRVCTVVDVPVCIDTPNPVALAAALAVAPGKPLVNSVTGEEKSLRAVLPLVKERGAAVIGLVMDEDGIPATPEARTMVAGKILERAARSGIPPDDIIIDALVLTVGADSHAAAVTLRTVEMVRREFGVSISLGASNVSFGLPDRHTINQAFLALAIEAGANCLITDSARMTATARAADLLLGRDPYARRFVTYFRAHPPKTM